MKGSLRRDGQRTVNNPERLEKITAALETSKLLMLELYCRNSACPAREILLRIKDYDDEFTSRVKREGMVCPVCSAQVVMHWVQTGATFAMETERSARIDVNLQMFVRDLKRDDPDRLVVVQASKYTDDRLPPTPDGWFGSGAPAIQRRRFMREGDK